MKLRDNPCPRCGWKYPGFHVCVDLSQPIDRAIQNKHNQAYMGLRTPEHRARLAAGLTERWRRHREETEERDLAIVEAYEKGMSMKNISREYGPAYQTVAGILMRAGVQIRPHGTNGKGDIHVR